MAGLSVFFLYNLTARAQDIGILSISNPSKEVIALKHFSLPHGLVPLLALALVVSMATPASAFFWQKKENTPAGVADFSKNTLAGGSVTFSQEDFRSSDLSSITLTALPDPKAGVLTVGGQPLTQGAVVDASAPLDIQHEDGVWFVEGPWLQRLMGNVNFADYESRMWFDKTLRESGLFQQLESLGIQDGDTVSMYDFEFEYQR